MVESTTQYPDGDEALMALFQNDRYDAAATDDAELARKFRMHGTPYVLPALILYRMWRQNLIDKDVALRSLEQLAEFISEGEYSTARVLMEGEQ